MKNSIFALAILLVGCISPPKPSECAMFKNGKFRYQIDNRKYIIQRSGSTQKEIFFNGKDSLTVVLNVKWVDDCTYTLTPTEETRIKTKTPKNAVVTVTITGTTPNSYMQTSRANFSDKAWTSEVFKID